MVKFIDYVKANITQPNIVVYASGPSINMMSPNDFELIQKTSYTIGVNYAPVKLKLGLNFWSDNVVTDFLLDLFCVKNNPRPALCTRFQPFPKDVKYNPLRDMIDCWFDKQEDTLQGNFTVVWLLQLLQKALPNKPVYIFGLDMKVDGKGPNSYKWYDLHTDVDYRFRGASFPAVRKLQECAEQLTVTLKDKNMFYNCNPDSGYRNFQFCDWKTVFTQ